ncbi:membrane protein [Aureimonas endophytica]|uniref:Membrane protein n=1 Tax=Aureimonas endophytica TaxID=2027858 RepID=A0A917E504_9HYPH|nr:DUF2231 domain-containing protein [Aureimonas endophytica]GGE01482.1 membrane protein [Aureimonas endophytica]
MSFASTQPTLRTRDGGHGVHAFLASFPVVCFTLALFTDIAFWQSGNIMWQNFSAWLLFAGLVGGGLAVIAGLVDLVIRRRGSGRRRSWLHSVGSFLVLVLAFINSLVHAGDGWTAVVPYGLALSAVTAVLMLLTAWIGHSLTKIEEGRRNV